MIACTLIPRLSLLAAIGERRELLRGPVALAPEPGGSQAIGDASGAAEAFGVRAGPTRLCAHAAAQRSRPRRAPVVVPTANARTFLAGLPVDLLCGHLSTDRTAPGREAEEAGRLVWSLERLGIETLNDLAALP